MIGLSFVYSFDLLVRYFSSILTVLKDVVILSPIPLRYSVSTLKLYVDNVFEELGILERKMKSFDGGFALLEQ